MANLSRKKSRTNKKVQANDFGFVHSLFAKILFQFPTAIFLFVFIYIWSSSSTIISGNVVHVCVSSRKLKNLHCLSAGSTQTNFQIPVPLINDDFTSTSRTVDETEATKFNISTSIPTINQVVDVKQVPDFNNKSSMIPVPEKVRNVTLDYAYVDVEEQLRVQRSWISSSKNAICEGRGVYVYELPSKFNKDLLSQCGDMIPWMDICKSFTNEALGDFIDTLGRGWYHTHQYSLEPIFHARILNHPCRVYNQDEAKLFYVPYYGGLDVLRWHFKNVTNEDKDSLALDVVRWLETQSPWYRNLGKDHVFVLGKISWDFRRNETSSWGTRLLELDEMQNPVKLLIERQPWHVNDVGIPHPTFFHPQTDDDIITWQTKVIKSERRSLVSFVGAARPGSPDSIRSILIEQCVSTENEQCKFLNCSTGKCDQPEAIVELFLESEFCLQPPGDSPTRKSVFDSLVSGCIPVMFDALTAYYQYPWHLPEDREKYSVFIDKEEMKKGSVSVVERLKRISGKKRENMRRYIVYELLPGLVYGDLDSKFDKFQDAFSVTINNLLERVNRLNEL